MTTMGSHARHLAARLRRKPAPAPEPGGAAFIVIALLTVALVAVIAFSASYQHQYELAIRHGQTHWVAGMLPLSVDLLIVAAGLVIWYAALHSYPRPLRAYLALGAGVAATVIANLAADARGGWAWLGPGISVWPAIAFVAAYEMAVWLVRKRQDAARSAGMDRAATTRTALYRLFGLDDELLYIGITINPDQRMREHSWRKPWWNEVKRHAVEWYDSWPEAAQAEQAVIAAEAPKYNVSTRVDPGTHLAGPVPQTALDAARAAYVASIEAGNPLSGRAMSDRFGISRRRADQVRAEVAQEMPVPPQRWLPGKDRAQAAKVRQLALSEANGHHPAEIARSTT